MTAANEQTLKELKDLSDKVEGLTSSVAGVVKSLEGYATTDDIGTIMQALDSDRNMLELRLKVLTTKAAQHDALRQEELTGLREMFTRLERSFIDFQTSVSDRLAKVEDTTKKLGERHSGLAKWIQTYFGIDVDWTTSTLIDKFRGVVDEMTGRVETVEGNLGMVTARVDEHHAHIGALRTDVDNHTSRLDALARDVEVIKAQNAPISKWPIFMWMILGVVVGAFIGWATYSAILGALIGGGLGLGLGLMLIAGGPKKSKAHKSSKTNAASTTH